MSHRELTDEEIEAYVKDLEEIELKALDEWLERHYKEAKAEAEEEDKYYFDPEPYEEDQEEAWREFERKQQKWEAEQEDFEEHLKRNSPNKE